MFSARLPQAQLKLAFTNIPLVSGMGEIPLHSKKFTGEEVGDTRYPPPNRVKARPKYGGRGAALETMVPALGERELGIKEMVSGAGGSQTPTF